MLLIFQVVMGNILWFLSLKWNWWYFCLDRRTWPWFANSSERAKNRRIFPWLVLRKGLDYLFDMTTLQWTVGQAEHQWDICGYNFLTTRYPVAFWEMCESLLGLFIAPTCLTCCRLCRRYCVVRQSVLSLCLSFLSLTQHFNTLALTYSLITSFWGKKSI